MDNERPPSTPTRTADVVVIGAGQAGLSAAYHLRRRGLTPYDEFVVLDANTAPGGAWQHRWQSLTMRDLHGVAALPDHPVPDSAGNEAAREFVPAYFGAYEDEHELPVLRPVRVVRVADAGGPLRVETDAGTWVTSAVINATGTWERPFWPHYPGADTFRGRQLHTVDYEGPWQVRNQQVVVVGGGHSAVQILGEIATVASTTWVTRRPPLWRDDDFGREQGRAAVALVENRVRLGLPPQSVVSVTGLSLREQEQAAAARGAYERLPMFARIEPDGVRWDDATFQPADVIVWATGFRAALGHLAPLGLREPTGGVRLVARPGTPPTTAARDHRVQLVGYGTSASTIGANRAGRAAALAAMHTAETAAQPLVEVEPAALAG